MGELEHKIELIKIVLETRLKIVQMARDKYAPSDEDRAYYQGKAHGYEQALELLESTEASISVEIGNDRQE